jgi:hypothetical protein
VYPLLSCFFWWGFFFWLNNLFLFFSFSIFVGANRCRKKHKNAASRMSGLIQSEETRLRQLSEGRMENARLNREVQRLEQALGRKQNRGNSRSPTRA